MVIKRLLLYIVLVIGCTYLILISAWTHLSSTSLTPWLEYQFNQHLPKRYAVDISTTTTRLTGLEINGLSLKDQLSDSVLVDAQVLELSFSIMRLLLFQEIDLMLKIYEGQIEATLDFFPQRRTNYKFVDIQINRNGIVRKSNLIVTNPIVSGDGTLLWEDSLEGRLTLGIDQLTLSGAPKNTNLPLELPDISFDRLEGEVLIKDNINEIRVNSRGDINANIEGRVGINPKNVMTSTLDMNLTGSITPDFEAKLGIIKSILDNYKNSAGQLSLSISGNLQKPIVKKNQ